MHQTGDDLLKGLGEAMQKMLEKANG